MSDAVHLDVAIQLQRLPVPGTCCAAAWFELHPRTFCEAPKGHCGPHESENSRGGFTRWRNDECGNGGDGGGSCGRPHFARRNAPS